MNGFADMPVEKLPAAIDYGLQSVVVQEFARVRGDQRFESWIPRRTYYPDSRLTMLNTDGRPNEM